jgi:hypothetical protein
MSSMSYLVTLQTAPTIAVSVVIFKKLGIE